MIDISNVSNSKGEQNRQRNHYLYTRQKLSSDLKPWNAFSIKNSSLLYLWSFAIIRQCRIEGVTRNYRRTFHVCLMLRGYSVDPWEVNCQLKTTQIFQGIKSWFSWSFCSFTKIKNVASKWYCKVSNAQAEQKETIAQIIDKSFPQI